ncbi:hypothetical protein L8X29_07525, partial [Campylobacter lari]|nr:hypothetical protein [Campylobacter lari]
MTAYVHIGTPKTGTTTIQNFCEINRLLLLEQGYLYSESVDKVKKRHSLIEDVVNEIYRNSAKIDLIEKIVKFKKQYLVLKQEILANQNKFFLFSSEAISGTFNNIVQIEILKKIMNNLGFNTIYIVVYIRNIKDFVISMASQSIKSGYLSPCEANPSNYFRKHIFDYRWICQNYAKVFGKEKLIVRLFDVDEFYHRDLIKDFIYSVGLKWNDNFIIPGKINESLNLIGFELQSRLNKLGCGGWNREKENNTLRFAEKYFQNFDDPGLKFQPCEKILQDYIDYFQDSNEWVRKNFFPFKAELFAKQNFIGYKENDILQNIKPLYWDSIANFVAEIINDKSKKIKQKNNKITD